MPQHYVRRQTLANAERYITPKLKELEDMILGAEEKLVVLEYEYFCEIRKTIADQVIRIQKRQKRWRRWMCLPLLPLQQNKTITAVQS